MNDSRIPSILIEGRATVSAKADIGFVDLYTRAEGMLLEDAVAEAASRAARIVSGMKSSSLEIKSIVVSDFQIGERKQVMSASRESPKPEVIKNILVTIAPSPETAVRIVDVASRLGASLQSPLSGVLAGSIASSAILYGLANCGEFEDLAMKAAIESAQTIADRTVKHIGKRVGPILEMTRIERSGTGNAGWGGIPRKAKDSKFSTDYLSLSPERIDVTASLTIRFELLG